MRHYFIVICIFVVFGSVHLNADEKTTLQGILTIVPAIPEKDPARITPGTPVILKAEIQNIGKVPNDKGTLSIRYAYIHPFHEKEGSILFETEKIPLPSLAPGEKTEIAFMNPHPLPSASDYIRYDWPMRQYEAVAYINGKEVIIGRVALSLSAHFYQGPQHKITAAVP